MARTSTYLAAKSVAESVESHFAQLLAHSDHSDVKDLAFAPKKQVIELILDAAFWFSLRREEGLSPKISLALLPPDQAEQPMLLKKPLPLHPDYLIKIAPGVERPGIHLGVWMENGELYVWGSTRKIPSLCFVVDVSEPGLLVVKHRRSSGYGKYVNVAVLKGDQVKLVDEKSAFLPDCPSFISTLLGFNSPTTWGDTANVLVQLAVSMRAHAHGGSLLVVPGGTTDWKQSIVHPISYAVQPVFCGLAEMMKQSEQEKKASQWQAALQQEIASVAGLTAVDGATIIDDSYNLLAFGAKIGRPAGAETVEQILVTEPVVGGKPKIVHPAQNGGTRHLSAAQFVHDQRNAIALIASQDGRFTIFSWSPCENVVQAHRIDSLLL
ncbi:putative sensor domain DACNV-containing protein [Pontibacter sp. SGAir0037]|uniref:putative sensor domain DACNV-containing protein n=1 Tax=Pontibacter sp. SGAir0037 TaxID=2571030 RepID=UPI0010CCB8E1|nr:hypothetical protein [Pontibacter sp. SGAir0037]QCR22080.1 hypothetical protein C1N53_06815 [Pontibacter sp. SGAir0037]